MIIDVDTASGAVALRDPEVFTAFHVAAPAGASVEQVLDTLGPLGRRCERDDHVYVSADGVRELAGDAAGGDWASGYDGMLGYARGKGWTDPTGEWVQAHIERA